MIISHDGNAEASTSRVNRAASPLLESSHGLLTKFASADVASSSKARRRHSDDFTWAMAGYGGTAKGRNRLKTTSPINLGYQSYLRSAVTSNLPQVTSSDMPLPAHRTGKRPRRHFFLPSPAESPPPPFTIHVAPQYRSMVSGACAGFVASIVTCPLDVLKTALQASSQAHSSEEYEGVRRTAWRIWKQSGVRGFYRGLGPTLAGYLPTWGIYFTVYDLVKDELKEVGRRFDTSFQHILAAMTAGATGTIFTNPIWVVKTRFMAQATLHPNELRYRNTLEAFATIYRTEGFSTFYRGLLPSLIGVIHVAVQFPLYEKFKSLADTHQAGSDDHSSLPASTILGCSAASKMIASVATYPHEVLRTRLQINKSHQQSAAMPQLSAQEAAASSSTSRSSQSGTGRLSAMKPSGGAISQAGSPSPGIHPAQLHPQLYSPLVTGSNPPGPRVPLLPPGEARPLLVAPGSAPAGVPAPTRRFGQRGGIIDTFMQIKVQDGWRGFYRGLSINLVRTVPNSAVTMLTYELIMRRLA